MSFTFSRLIWVMPLPVGLAVAVQMILIFGNNIIFTIGLIFAHLRTMHLDGGSLCCQIAGDGRGHIFLHRSGHILTGKLHRGGAASAGGAVRSSNGDLNILRLTVRIVRVTSHHGHRVHILRKILRHIVRIQRVHILAAGRINDKGTVFRFHHRGVGDLALCILHGKGVGQLRVVIIHVRGGDVTGIGHVCAGIVDMAVLLYGLIVCKLPIHHSAALHRNSKDRRVIAALHMNGDGRFHHLDAALPVT